MVVRERRRRRRIERKEEVEVAVCASGDRCLLRLVFVHISFSLQLYTTYSVHYTQDRTTLYTALIQTLSNGTSPT